MADPIPTPNPAPAPPAKAWWKTLLLQIATYVVTAVVGGVLYHYGLQPAPPVIPTPEPPVWLGEPGKPSIATADGSSRPTHGWILDPDQIDANLDPIRTAHFDLTAAGKAVMGDEDVFLWQSVRKVNNRGPPWYPNVDQKSVGCCVGCGWKHSADICQATSILSGHPAEWKPVSVEAIYGGSRVEIGGGTIRGDGSVGAWAAKWCSTYGLAAMEKYPDADLSTFDPARARAWGKSGVPKGVEQVAKSHPVKSTALVKTWADVKRAIQQGYPVAVCSNQGFTMTRNADGFARASGTWGHCMCICGVRKAPHEGGFILNSWGDSAHSGPVWPADAPVAGFWADSTVIARMVGEGDSFALSDVVGFPARSIDWGFGVVVPRPPVIRPAALFGAFAPELAH